ncbi:hypothetical protein SAMN05216548_104125 [Faunimonas pinastri]|uniref:Uncharacterized protein n=1 Tax=Faunimonas pinastri TaxID=1855383 RepID=A0A1H9FI06_9HYPH|nr:hypothetical protein [Faunimonas pinastri]SEQ37591.1 hypothetical protein SAMN05216548_104125 [Faunimonas pinastri]
MGARGAAANGSAGHVADAPVGLHIPATTARAATAAPWPIFVPAMTKVPAPIQTS